MAKPKPKRAQLGSAASRIFHFHGLFIAASVAARVEQLATGLVLPHLPHMYMIYVFNLLKGHVRDTHAKWLNGWRLS